jgi:phosphate:Na+ symporter
VPLANLMRAPSSAPGVAALPQPGRRLADADRCLDDAHAVNFHTAFNALASLVFLPLVDVVAWACRALLPDKPVPDDPGKPRISIPTCSIRRPRRWAARCARR